jgi:hypothetical protein
MYTSNNTSIISKFITKEVEHIYKKYNSIPEDEMNMIKQFIEKLEENHINFDPYLSYTATKTTAEICTEIEDIDLLRLYFFMLQDLSLDIRIGEVKEAYRGLNDEGYSKIRGYYLYKNEETMKELAKDELDTKLEDAYEVAAMFSEEEIADMWIFGTSKEEAARQYLRDNNWWQVLECDEPEEGYTDFYGDIIYYCYNGGEE